MSAKRRYSWVKHHASELDSLAIRSLSDGAYRTYWSLNLLALQQTPSDGRLPNLQALRQALGRPITVLREHVRELKRASLLQERSGRLCLTRFGDEQEVTPQAKRMRRLRERAASLARHGSVTVTPSDGTVTGESRGKSPEGRVQREEDRGEDEEGRGRGAAAAPNDPAWTNLIATWENTVEPITDRVARHLDDLAKEAEQHRLSLPPAREGSAEGGCAWVVAAINTASESSENGKHITVAYVRSILNRWQRDGFRAPFQPGGRASGEGLEERADRESEAAISKFLEKHKNG
jgi:hypothetical protein